MGLLLHLHRHHDNRTGERDGLGQVGLEDPARKGYYSVSVAVQPDAEPDQVHGRRLVAAAAAVLQQRAGRRCADVFGEQLRCGGRICFGFICMRTLGILDYFIFDD